MDNPNAYITPERLLIGLGVIGMHLSQGTSRTAPVTHMRTILGKAGFTDAEINAIFYVIRDRGIPGARVEVSPGPIDGAGQPTPPIWKLVPNHR